MPNKDTTYVINTDAYKDVSITFDGQPIDTTYNINTSAYTSDLIFNSTTDDIVVTVPQESVGQYSSFDYYGDIVLSFDEPDQER